MKKKLLLLSLLAVLLLLKDANAQYVKPYLQAAKPTSVWVSWKTDNGTNPTVRYGLSANNLAQTVYGTTVNLEPKDYTYNTPYHWHNVKLTGLTPDTGYYYEVRSGASDRSEVHYFRTPPALGSKKDKLRFIVLGDHQVLNYQGSPYMKFNELVQAAKSKAEQLYGTPIANNINLIINDGDQVDVGTLNHYENIHFAKQSYITPNLPLITAVGNHETYGSMGIEAYYEHFILNDEFDYKGISSGTERYYTYQLDNVLIMVLDTELTGNTQLNWAKSVISKATTDASVDWIVTISHRPYQAEQYSNDYSGWYGNSVLPALKSTDKFVLHIAGHHHLYARGQFKDHSGYHMISGGTAWPQYWGDSGNETDHQETQGSWSNFAYQIIEVDNVNEEMKVQSYTIGSLDKVKNNELLDEFHLRRGLDKPTTPSVTNNVSEPVTLPYTFKSSAYYSAAQEPFNSTQFQVSSTEGFSTVKIDELRHFENYYGPDGQRDETRNIGLGQGIFDLTIRSNQLSNGSYFVRVRHRDQSLNWSEWSVPLSFEINGSVDADPAISLNKQSYAPNEIIQVSYANAPGNAKDWIGIYKKGNIPGMNASTQWAYIGGNSNGTASFSIAESGEYFVTLFENDGYTELAGRIYFWVGSTPVLTSDKPAYNEGENVDISYTSAPANPEDWIGIYKVGVEPSAGAYASWQRVSGVSGSLTFSDLPKGYYYATYHLNNGYAEVGERIYFQVGTQITTISTDKNSYGLGEPVTITFADTPGKEKDWLGIYHDGDTPGIEQLYTYKYFDGLTNGSTVIDGTEGNEGAPNQLPVEPGRYFIVMFTDDSYNEVSNRVYFDVTDLNPATSVSTDKLVYNSGDVVKISFAHGPGNTWDWIGIYKKDDTPGTQYAYKWKYVDGKEAGTLSFANVANGEYFVNLFENNGYVELAERKSFRVGSPLTASEVVSSADGKIKVYPNPFNKYLNIEAVNPITKVVLIDPATGATVMEESGLEGKSITLKNKALVPGNYLLKVHAGKTYEVHVAIEK
ncbi:fibronectin type III domain-containing protein [Fulvivirga ulvae]|uniref:fibronectin type III domain-containing protein n=1 Tax=Fulvivirga ulvae TaxID=2904245 RepID=UPI001F269D0C|nr:fibronectin type III domain-containing protein [Fulvivirga ulvae]UII32770.1 fibronectin type III domain-containing protein [Fulvivirga ulvae]